MGYSTNYELSILEDEVFTVPSCTHKNPPKVKFCSECGASTAPDLLLDRVMDEITKIDDYNPFADSCKWYEHDDHMREISKKYPMAVFVLHGNGEEQGDSWYKYYKNGKMQECKAKITFDPYDENELK
jgi:hypothetical protein